MDEDSINMDLGFQTGRDWVLVFCTKNKDSVSVINKYFHNLSSNILFQYSKVLESFQREGTTAYFGQGFCCLLNLPSAIEEERYLIQHMKHVPQVFLKGIKLHFTLLLKKRITSAI